MIDIKRSSPHFNERPDNTKIKLLVIHNISLPPESFAGPWIDDLFMGRIDVTAHPYFKSLVDIKVSAHLLINRKGEVIQYVPFKKRAWHAGESAWKGEKDCNNYSIGIEIEGSDHQPFSELQYQTLSRVAFSLIQNYPELSQSSICGHADIAPERKTDPGPHFDWEKLHYLINKIS